MNLISTAISIIGLHELAAECSVTYQAVQRWKKNGCLPRTEWTGETNYSEIIEKLTKGQVTKKQLLGTRGILNSKD